MGGSSKGIGGCQGCSQERGPWLGVMQGLVSCCLSNARPWHEPVCPCRVLCLTGEEEEEDEGLTSLIQD